MFFDRLNARRSQARSQLPRAGGILGRAFICPTCGASCTRPRRTTRPLVCHLTSQQLVPLAFSKHSSYGAPHLHRSMRPARSTALLRRGRRPDATQHGKRIASFSVAASVSLVSTGALVSQRARVRQCGESPRLMPKLRSDSWRARCSGAARTQTCCQTRKSSMRPNVARACRRARGVATAAQKQKVARP